MSSQVQKCYGVGKLIVIPALEEQFSPLQKKYRKIVLNVILHFKKDENERQQAVSFRATISTNGSKSTSNYCYPTSYPMTLQCLYPIQAGKRWETQSNGICNRPFSYSAKEHGSSDIFIHFYTRGSIEWR